METKNLFLSKLLNIIFLIILTTPPAYAKIKSDALSFQGPLVVDDAYIRVNGNLIVGNYQGTTAQAAITITTASNVIISNSILQGPGDLIQAVSVPANITVTHTSGTGTNPNVRGMQKGIFLHVNSFTNISMQNNNISGVRLGFYCNGYAGNHTSSNTLVIDNNLFTNLDARPSNGSGGFAATGQYNGQAVHLGNIYGVPGIDIGWNEIMNTANQSSTGALIEINESSGTSSSPLQIHNNYISGAFPSDPGKDLYGYGAILVNGALSDTVKTASSFINIANNSVVASANYGIAIAAGHDVMVINNRVVSSGFLPDGKTFYPMSTYGNAAGAVNINLYNQPASVFFNNNVTNNVLGLIKNNGSNAPVRSDWNLPGQNGAVEGNTDFLPNDSSDPTIAAEAQELVNYQQTLLANNITVGSSADVGYAPDGGALTSMPPVNTGTSGQLTLDHVKITNPSGDCIAVGGNSTGQVTITNSVIGPCGGRGIHVTGIGNALIQNNYVHDTVAQGISVEVVASETILRNTIENSGFAIYLASNNSVTTHAQVNFNKIINVLGISGQGVSAVQFNQISGPNNSISCNLYYQPPSQGLHNAGDSFSLFLSSGTVNSPLQVVGNRIIGIGNGGGMMLVDGDTGPNTTGPGYVYAGDNYLLNPGGYGIQVATGHDIVIDKNYVYGNNYDFWNSSTGSYGPGGIGINTFNVYSSLCFNMTVTNNTVYYLSNRTRGGVAFDYGLSSQCDPTTQFNNTGYDLGDTFTYPAFDTPRSSCLALSEKSDKMG